MELTDIANRFGYHRPKDDLTVADHELVRKVLADVALVLNAITPEGREKSTAVTKLEEAMFWYNAAIARNQ
jgi:hypothetical protein